MKSIRVLLPALAILAAAAMPTAADNASAAGGPGAERVRVAVVPLKGSIDNVLEYVFNYNLEKAAAHNPDYYIFDMTTWGGALGSAETIAQEIFALKAKRKIVYVNKRAISSGAYIAFAADEIVMQVGSKIGDCLPILYTQDGIQALPEKIQTSIRAHFRAGAEKNHWPVALGEAMVTPGIAVWEVTLQNDSRIYIKSRVRTSGGDVNFKIGGKTVKLGGSVEVDPERVEAEKKRIMEKYPGLKGEPVLVDDFDTLLTMTPNQAVRFGIASGIESSLDDYIREFAEKIAAERGLPVGSFETSDVLDVLVVENNWWEDFSSLLMSTYVKIILIVIGLIGFYIEFNVPGFGIPGIVGIVCFLLVLFAHHLFGLAEFYEIAMILVGIGLIGVEIFVIPGFTVAGISGLILLFAGMLLSFQNFVLPSEGARGMVEMDILKSNLMALTGSFVIFLVCAVILARFLPKTKMFNRLVLVSYKGDKRITPADNKWTDMSALAGRSGKAETYLRPAGKAVVDDRLVDVVSRGEFIEAGSDIIVVEVEGGRVVVEKAGEKKDA